MTETYRYWAFLSYSHRDERWAQRLHRAIERFCVPPRFVGQPTPSGDPAPRRFQPLFRDRDELPASADLGHQLEAALAASRYLIVLCSPAAAASQWVNREIEVFRELGRGDRVVALLVEGADEEASLPPALLADPTCGLRIRVGNGGRDRTMLEVLAHLLGVGFHMLDQAEQKRRTRRLRWTVAAATLVTAGFASLGWYANEQRIAAVRQREVATELRQHAEGVLDYLVRDVGAELASAGRPDLVTLVRGMVDRYYLELDTGDDDPRALVQRASALERQGLRLEASGEAAAGIATARTAAILRVRAAQVLDAEGRVAARAAWQEAFEAFRGVVARDPEASESDRQRLEQLRSRSQGGR